jgi:hypothetical protein
VTQFCIPFATQFYSSNPLAVNQLFSAHCVITVSARNRTDARLKATSIFNNELERALSQADVYEEL